jgi:hypothetical protein
MHKYLLVVFACGILTAGVVAVKPRTANAKQCIYNKSGFWLRVLWYHPTDLVIYRTNGKSGQILRLKVKRGKRPEQVDSFPTLQGRCTRGRLWRHPMTAILQAVGGKFVGGLTRTVTGAVTVLATGALVAGTCVLSEGIACDGATEGGTTLANAALVVEARTIPDGKETFLITTPSTRYYLDIWGTIWNPQHGRGGRIRN